MSLYCAKGSIDTDLSPQQLDDLHVKSLDRLGTHSNVLAVPPDQSREHSRAGELTGYIYKHFRGKLKAVLWLPLWRPERNVVAVRPQKLSYGYNQVDGGEEVFFVPNPGLGLWAHRSRL